MNDTQLLNRLAATDAYPPELPLPEAAREAEAALALVLERGSEEPISLESPPPRRAGWLYGAAAFVIVVLVGVVLAIASTRTSDAPANPPSTTIVEQTTTSPTVPPEPTAFEVAPTPAVGITGENDLMITPDAGGANSPGSGADLVVPGTIEAQWYRGAGAATGFLVVVFRGLDLEETGSLCPGSILLTDMDLVAEGAYSFARDTPGASAHPSRGPAPPEGNPNTLCFLADDLAEPPAGSRTCGSLVYQLTEIPIDAEGALVADVSRTIRGEWLGQISVVEGADFATLPLFEPDRFAYDLPASGSYGAESVSCPPE